MRFLALIAALLAALSLPATAAESGYYGRQKVVYHINQPGGADDKAYIMAMQNVRNHINAVGAANIEVKVVMHGDGLDMLKSAKTNNRLQMSITDLKSQNVGFLVCDNTLKGRNINPDTDLFDVYRDDIVPSGVAELSRLQHMGFTYIRP
jgi:intracellular sulfur oxidation DsrE/DsrF family protein